MNPLIYKYNQINMQFYALPAFPSERVLNISQQSVRSSLATAILEYLLTKILYGYL